MISGVREMNEARSCLMMALFLAAISFLATAVEDRDSTNVYASLPAQIEIQVPSQYENLQLMNCSPSSYGSATSGVEVRSNLNWSLNVAGSTATGHMIGSTGTPLHELHSPMTVRSLDPAGGPVTIPGIDSSPAMLLTNIAPGDYSGSSIISLTFEQFFGWNDYADDDYRLTLTLTAAPT